MAIYRFFGKQGVGKTAYIYYLAQRENDRILNGKSKYDRVLCNVPLVIEAPTEDDVRVYLFDSERDFGVYDMSNALILNDESQFDFDSRDHKSLPKHVRRFLVYHRHFRTSIAFFSQYYSGLDNRIRELTNAVFQLSDRFGVTVPTLVEYQLFIPRKPSRAELMEQNCTDLRETYYRAGFFSQLLSRISFPKIRRSKLYGHWDSYSTYSMPKKAFNRMAWGGSN